MNIKPFRGLRPSAEQVREIASRPYDVISSEEARIEASTSPLSFLNVVKPEITLAQDIDPYDNRVYEAGKRNFQKLLDEGVFARDKQECLYIYELIMDGHSQTGIVACAWIDDYLQDRIRKHELTRPDKENDRKKHIRVSMINAEPVFFAYRSVNILDRIVEQVKNKKPVYDFAAVDGIVHRLWVVDNHNTVNEIVQEFVKIPQTYVADGHHRTAAAALVGEDLRQEDPGHRGDEEYNYFLAVHFPDNQLQIIDYNRVVRDLNGHDPASFIKALSGAFEIKSKGRESYRPETLHEMGMYLDSQWYALRAKPVTFDDTDPVGVLDVTILSKQILEPVLNITDLRTDKRIEFVGGIRGLQELEKRVDSGEMAVAFAMFPVTMQQLMDIADSGNIMPPKTTWFEPKLRSGLVVHSLV